MLVNCPVLEVEVSLRLVILTGFSSPIVQEAKFDNREFMQNLDWFDHSEYYCAKNDQLPTGRNAEMSQCKHSQRTTAKRIDKVVNYWKFRKKIIALTRKNNNRENEKERSWSRSTANNFTVMWYSSVADQTNRVACFIQC